MNPMQPQHLQQLAQRAQQVCAAPGAGVSVVPSPCVSVCRMDEASGLCEGCLRTIDEIAAWSRLGDAAKRQVWQQLALRAVALEAQR